jgi:hypothetical protein
MTKRHQLEENLGAAEVELTISDLAGITRAATVIQVEGERYPPQIQPRAAADGHRTNPAKDPCCATPIPWSRPMRRRVFQSGKLQHFCGFRGFV